MSDLEKRINALEIQMEFVQEALRIKPPVVEPPFVPPIKPPPIGRITPAGWKEGDQLFYLGTGKDDHNIRYDAADGNRSGNIDATCVSGSTNWYLVDLPKLKDLVGGDALGFRNSVVNHPVRNSGVFYGGVAFQQDGRQIAPSCCGYEISTTASTKKHGIELGKPFYFKISQSEDGAPVGGFRFSWGIYTYWKDR